MKNLIASIAAIIACVGVAAAQEFAPTPPPPAPQGATPESLLPALIEHSRTTARIENGRLVGDGADLLRALGAQSQFVMIGEDHGDAGIAAFAEAYWRDLNDVGFSYAAFEIDPWIARALERELRQGGASTWTNYIKDHGGAFGAPFFTWAPEVQLAEAVTSSTPRRATPTIWGLDQTFIGAAPSQLRDIAQSAHSAAARALAGELASDAQAHVFDWLGRSDPANLERLRGLLTDRRDADNAALVEAMQRSQRIYGPFTGGEGEVLFANADREHLMKENFLADYRAAEASSRALPRVMMKFGANHIYRGPSPTGVFALGGFVSEFALTTGGGGAVSLYVQCGPGGMSAMLIGPPQPCDTNLSGDLAFLAPFVDPNAITIFDLRVWKLRPRRWENIPPDARELVRAFDFLVLVPNGAPSPFLEGLPPPQPPPQ